MGHRHSASFPTGSPRTELARREGGYSRPGLSRWREEKAKKASWESSEPKGKFLLELRQGWKLKEFGECPRWREQQENQGAESFMGFAWIFIHSMTSLAPSHKLI